MAVTKACRICKDVFEAGVVGFSIQASLCDDCATFSTKVNVVNYKADKPCNRCGKPLPLGRRFNCRDCLPDGCQTYPGGDLYFGPYGPDETIPSEYGEMREVCADLASLSEC